MENKDFIKEYDDIQNGKKVNVRTTLIYAITSGLMFLGMLIWTFSIHVSTVDKIKVVDTSGNYLDSKVVRRDKLMKTLITGHCDKAVYFANSFERMTVKENQAHTYFLINKSDADKVFETYLSNNAYNDALSRGYEYETKFVRIEEFDVTQQPWSVKFLSELTIIKGETTQKYYIVSTGKIVTHTAQYPENPFGLFFVNYQQEFKNHGGE